MKRLAVLLVLGACWTSHSHSTSQGSSSEPSSSQPAAPSGKPGPLGCIEDAAAKKACAAQGAAWQYSYPAPRQCSGVDEGPQPPKPPPACECIEQKEYERLVKECSEVP